jgi:hypothetical protein
MTEIQKKISETCENLQSFLLEKNKKYGNSALEPLNIFSKLPAKEGICVRLDDKLKRILNMNLEDEGIHDTIIDVVGYLILLLIAIDGSDKFVEGLKDN